MPVLTEGTRFGEAIMSEGNFHVSRENAMVAASQTIPNNALVGRVARPADVVVTQSYAGTGNGTLTLANPSTSSKVVDGRWSIRCISAAANGGTFRVERPDGTEAGTVAVGAAFNKEIKFTINDGATDYVVGDEFAINVAADDADYSIAAFNPVGTDGSEIPYGYVPYGITTGAGEINKKLAVLVRDCELNGNCIAWPAGITDAQRADAMQALAVNHVIVRY